MRNAEDLITNMIERRSRIDSKGDVSLTDYYISVRWSHTD